MIEFQERHLHELYLPMSHNSATFYHQAFGQVRLTEAIVLPFGKKWDRCQNLSIYGQLKSGVRFLDLRLATLPVNKTTSETFCVHGFVCDSLSNILDEIKNFLDDHPSETVVVSMKQGYKSLTGIKWKCDWLNVASAIGNSSILFERLAINKTVKELAGKAVFISPTKERIGFFSDYNSIFSWSQTQESDPLRLAFKLEDWCYTKRNDANESLYILESQCTPSDLQVRASYLPHLRWSASSSDVMFFSNLKSMHDATWPLIRNRVIKKLRRPMSIAVDFCTGIQCEEIICLNDHSKKK